ncbi:site-specific DNA-methyltransferase [Chitinophaga sp. GCM10012297]|uniref:Site-specific DNA-methyltransferase n=1 Tax=Chitinophaga chungangae TaxID=2821488 RepID=A0ABS3YEF7_9BACT|nr:site-specific DNA-methyltransferase [Chitinophaga chungangae]MBO9153061.1 site-specific DNA-methyltransferase [Chitinophaga chungangae]
MAKKRLQKLELTWIGKGEELKLEPRILVESPEYSYGDPDTGNMLIQGDNLLALKALEQEYAGKVKCIYIDPPFNTGAAFENYDDGIEHSIWLDLMYRRLRVLYSLLHNEGSIFVHLDDNEADYCKVILDAIFGRNNFISRITVDARSPSAFSTVNPGVFKSSEYMLWYAKNKSAWESRSMRIASTRDMAYNRFIVNRDEDESKWIFIPLKQAFLECVNKDKLGEIESFLASIYSKCQGLTKKQIELWIKENITFHLGFNLKLVSNYLHNKLAMENYSIFKQAVYMYILEKCSYNYTEVDFDDFVFKNSHSVFRETEISDDGAGQEIVRLKYTSLEAPSKIFKLIRGNELAPVYISNGKQISFYSKNVEEIDGKLSSTKLLTNIWTDISWEGIAKEGGVKFKKGKKPERLLKRCLELATNEGDLVLDSFLGSGTTAAVAHKMRRKYIGIELGEQAVTHSFSRLKSVVDNDQTGISKAVNWKGGGGFKFYTLAPSLLKLDKFDNWIISEEYNADMLAAAMAKQEGFVYRPSETQYWKQGQSSEQDFIFTTTQFFTLEALDRIHETMQTGESLLICCKAFQQECISKYSNITIKKIPQLLLNRCEFGKDDYSLNIVNLPTEKKNSISTNDKSSKQIKPKTLFEEDE